MTKKRHHYLPESHLARFATDGRVFVFDKVRGEFRSHTPRETGHRRYFYLTEEEQQAEDKETQVVEDYLERIENESAPALLRILTGKDPEKHDKSKVSWLVATLMSRTPQAHARVEELEQALMTHLLAQQTRAQSTDSGLSPEVARQALDLFQSGDLEWEIPRNLVLHRMMKAIEKGARLLFDTRWVVYHAPQRKSFVTGDGAHVLRGPPANTIRPDTFRVLVPLSAECCLGTDGEGQGIRHQEAADRFVRELNLTIAYASQELVVGRSLRLLQSLASYLQQHPHPSFVREFGLPPFPDMPPHRL